MRSFRSAFVVLFAAGALSIARQEPEPIRFVAGANEYEWVRGWGALPGGKTLGNTHGCIVVDREDRVYLCTDTEDAVVVFAPDGQVERTFGKELAGGLHGLALVDAPDGGQSLLMAHIGRHQVLGATLTGEILWTLDYPAESGIYQKPEQYLPTSVAPLPASAGGGFLVADGYGQSWIHRYDAERKYVKSFGGPGSELGQLRTPHGIWVETRGEQPVVLVADRENQRIQVFDLDGKALREVKDVEHDVLRRPCHIHPGDDRYVVADLAGRVTLLDRELALVAHLGDNPDPSKRARNDVLPAEWKDGEFISPHCASFDSRGNLYVTDWVSSGRITKLARVR
jgi:sugar lactone lactonase YvrE